MKLIGYSRKLGHMCQKQKSMSMLGGILDITEIYIMNNTFLIGLTYYK